MLKIRQKVSSLALTALLLALTSVVALAAREWVEGGTLIIYPDAANLMTQFDEVTVEYEYRFAEEPGVASATLIGYTDSNCGGGNDRWGGVPVSQPATEQTPELEGFTKLVMQPDPALFTPEIGSVTVEIRLQETNHKMVNRVDFYCRVTDHAATEAAAEAPEDQPSLAEITGPNAAELHSIEPGHVMWTTPSAPVLFGTLAPGQQVTADVSYQFESVPGQFRFVLVAGPASCHTTIFQSPGHGFDAYVEVSEPVEVTSAEMKGRATIVLTPNQFPDDARAVWLHFKRFENGQTTEHSSLSTCFNVEDHTIDLLSIDPGFVLDEELGTGQRIGQVPRDATLNASFAFNFDTVPGTSEVRLMGLDFPCERWLYNLSSSAIPKNSYPVSATNTQTFNALENTTSRSLAIDNLWPSTRSVYVEARTFENGVETEHNVFLSCSNLGG